MPKVELRPFAIERSRGCNWDFNKFCAHLVGCSGLKIEAFQGHDRVWVAEEDQEFVKICVITYLGPGGGMTIHPKTLLEKEWEVSDGSMNYRKNLMIISKTGLRGIYQSQAESFPISDAGRLISYFSHEFKKVQIAESAKQLAQEGSGQEKAERKAEKQWAGLFTLKAEMTKADFQKMVADMKEVGEFSWSFDVTKNKGGLFTPELKHAARSKGQVQFTPVTGKASGILKFITKYNPLRAKAKGLDADGIERIYYLQQKYEVLETYQDSEWKRRWDNKTIGEFASTQAVNTIIAAMKRDPRRFLQRAT